MALNILAIVMGVIMLTAAIWAWRIDNNKVKKSDKVEEK